MSTRRAWLLPALVSAPPALPVPRGGLAGDQAQIGHELARAAEALKVDDLGHQDHGRQRVDAAEAPEPPHRGPIGGGVGQRDDLLVQVGQAGQRLLEGEQGGVERALQGRQDKLLLADPSPMALAPVPAGPVDAAVARQELHDAVAPAQHIPPDIIPAPQQVAHRFLTLVRHVDRGQFARAEQPDQLGGIPPGPS